MTKKKYVKSPLNYTGGKFKLLPQILPLFPNDVNTFVDLFGGGFNVGVNIEANKIAYNERIKEVYDMMKYFQANAIDDMLLDIESISNEYGLNKYNKQAYLNFREGFNSDAIAYDVSIALYVLVCHSFSNQIRFNKKGCFNMPFGQRYFNPQLKSRFIDFVSVLQNKNIICSNKDFKRFDSSDLSNQDLVYCDPPYLISTATYNESNGWNGQNEQDLLNLLDNLNRQNVKFALSNVLFHKGEENKMLVDWSNRYNVHYLDADYSNCNYQLKDKTKSVEVLITNYQ